VVWGLILTIISTFIGVAAGAVPGYCGGWTDELIVSISPNSPEMRKP
jgi:ABC-type microcin C transport system permease subunit YejE